MLREGVAVPTSLHRAETWSIVVTENKIEYNGDEVSEEYVWSNAYGLSKK